MIWLAFSKPFCFDFSNALVITEKLALKYEKHSNVLNHIYFTYAYDICVHFYTHTYTYMLAIYVWVCLWKHTLIYSTELHVIY